MRAPKLLERLFTPVQNSETITFQACKLLNVQVTKTSVQQQLESHPDYPSMAAVGDVLNSYGIMTSEAYRYVGLDEALMEEVPIPFIAQAKIKGEVCFTVVSAAGRNGVTYFEPVTEKFVTTPVDDFNRLFSGVFLYIKKTEKAGENDYDKHLKEERRLMLTKILMAAIIPIYILFDCSLIFFKSGTVSLPAIVYTLLTLMGTAVGALLLWYEIDQYNPALQQICSAGKKTNCGAIIHSNASKIFGISWSAIGFTYFSGSLICLSMSGLYNLPVLFILSWLNVAALPYIAFSVYYQAKVAKQWCVLCLTVQALLALQFITALSENFHASVAADSVNTNLIFAVVLAFIIPFIIVSLLLPALRKAKESKRNITELQRLKHNPQIFDALLFKQKNITEPTSGLGITIGNPEAKYKLIKVCNPYCGPCAQAHPDIENLIENNPEIQLQIIFTASGEDNDIRTPPVKHLLAIAEKNNEEQTKEALDDWYLPDRKDYDAFAKKYPMNGELKQQEDKIKAMKEWCTKTEIAFTPTFFVNGYQLPSTYSVADLKYFLSV